MSVLDAAKNFAKATVSTGYDAIATSIVLTTGHALRLPATPFNATWWNSTDFPDPSDDPNVEIIRVTGRSTDTLTVLRGQESITATTKNTAGKTYKILAGPTAALIPQIAPKTSTNFYLGEYHASGSKVTTTGSITTGTATLTVASASTFAINQGIYIAGAGTAGAALVTTITAISGTTFTLATTASTTATTQLVQHDDTTAIQNALNDAAAAGTGRIYAEAGVYRVNGPFQDSNSILKIPMNGVGSSPPTKAVAIIGPPNGMSGWMGPNTEYTCVFQTDKVGATAESSILSAGAFTAGGELSVNATAVYLENIVFRSYNNPQISALDMGMAANLYAKHILIDVGVLYSAIVEPTRQCFGLRLATFNATNSHITENVSVQGHWFGIIFTEEWISVYSAAAICKVGMRGDFGYHPATGRITLFGCPTMLEFTDHLSVDFSLDYEVAQAGHWYSPLSPERDIYDPTDKATGVIHIHKSESATGNYLPVNKIGGTGLTLMNMNGLGLAPVLLDAEIGLVNASTVAITFSEGVKASNYQTGVTIKKNGVTQTISSATRQSTKSIVYYLLSAPVIGTDLIVFSYDALDGFIQSESGGQLGTITDDLVTNNLSTGLALSDLFTDTNGTAITAHTMNVGPGWTLVEGGSFVPVIQSNKLQTQIDAAIAYMCVSDSGIANQAATGTFTFAGWTGGTHFCELILRYSDINNYIKFSCGALATDPMRIEKWVAGVMTTIAGSPITLTPLVPYLYVATANGNNLSFTVNGITINVTDAFNNTATKCGWRFYNSVTGGSTLDDFQVADPAALVFRRE